MIRYDYFKMFITPEIINCVIEQTNLYSLQKNIQRTQSFLKFFTDWYFYKNGCGVVTII